MKKVRLLLMAVAVLLTFFSLSFDNAGDKEQEQEVYEYGSFYDVIRVIDGDTIVVESDGEEMKVRLIGVNTPESVHEDDSLNTSQGKEASAYMENLLTGKRVYLAFDKDNEDDYGRTLAYVYTEDKQFVNLLLVEQGYAECMTIQPNVMFSSVFEEAESAAKAADVGFWNNGLFAE